MRHPVTLASATTLMALAMQAAQAVPTAPEGWRSERMGTQQVYRPSIDAYAEVRVFAMEPTKARSLQDWLSDRGKQTVKGVTIVQQMGQPQVSGDIVIFSESLAQDAQGNKLAVMRGGCLAPQGKAQYSEMLLSTKASYDDNISKAGLKIMVQACMEARASEKDAGKPPSSPNSDQASDAPTPKPYAYYKPGAGIKASQIEAIVHSWTNEQAGMTMQVVDHYYVLLKDGSYREEMPPVAFEDFDVAAAKAGEPGQWGKWRRQQGAYEIASSEPNARFGPILRQTMRLPARKDEKLEGTWRHDSAYSTLWSVARSSRSVSFSRDGRFERSFASSVVGGAGSEAAGTAVHGATNRSDDCASGTMGGGNFTGGASGCRASTAPDRSGTYRLDGYTLALRYDNGRTERLPFCTRADRGEIWFEAWGMRRQKPGE